MINKDTEGDSSNKNNIYIFMELGVSTRLKNNSEFFICLVLRQSGKVIERV